MADLAMVLVGAAWLLGLRSRETSWKAAVNRWQIQTFNGTVLVIIGAALGLEGALLALVDLVPALQPARDVIRLAVVGVGGMCGGEVLRRILGPGT